jgi:hypothetical protein
MNQIEPMPARPLRAPDIAAMAAADGIRAVEPVAFNSDMGGIVAVKLGTGFGICLVRYFPDRRVWNIVDMWPRERED